MNRLSAILLLLAALATSHAQSLRINNAASGLACYKSQDLMTAHTALGYYEIGQVQALIASNRCFVMGQHWQAEITAEHIVRGPNAKMVEVTLRRGGEVRHAWSLLKNFDFIGDNE